MDRGISLGRVFGIRILLDPSLVIIFALVTISLGAGLFPAWHPEWDAVTSWLTAALASVLFFLSVLVHELSHALVGRRVGMDVQRITLFVFGGLAQLEGGPRSWRAEFAIAVIGPLTSLALAALFLGAGMTLAGGALPPTSDAAAAEAFVRELGAPATLLFWLGPINAILALFNLVPGFSLDGGRMLRAVLWGTLGSLRRATRYAATLGQGFAWLLITAGVAMVLGWSVPVFGEGLLGGLWLAFIGWFLNGAAVMSYQQLVVRETLEDVPVSRVAADDYDQVSAALPLDQFVDEHLLRSEQRALPPRSRRRPRGTLPAREHVRQNLHPARGREHTSKFRVGSHAVGSIRVHEGQPVHPPFPPPAAARESGRYQRTLGASIGCTPRARSASPGELTRTR